jgi:hypothetical protein
VQRFSGASMPGRMRVGRTLAYWSKPWQIFSRRPHSVTWSGMCGSPAEPNRMASLPRSASSPSAGIISPCARYQSPPQPKSLELEGEAAAGRGQGLQHLLAGGDHFLADAVSGNGGDAREGAAGP